MDATYEQGTGTGSGLIRIVLLLAVLTAVAMWLLVQLQPDLPPVSPGDGYIPNPCQEAEIICWDDPENTERLVEFVETRDGYYEAQLWRFSEGEWSMLDVLGEGSLEDVSQFMLSRGYVP